MKILTTLCILSLPLMSFASDSFIDAQMAITKGRVNNLRDAMTNKEYGNVLKASDYYAQLPEDERKLDEALAQFEDTVKNEVLGKLSSLVDDYNATYAGITNNSNFSEEQREGLLKILKQSKQPAIDKKVEEVKITYQNAIKKVYALIPFSLETVQFKKLNKHKKLFKEGTYYRAQFSFAGTAVRGSCDTNSSITEGLNYPYEKHFDETCIYNPNAFYEAIFQKKIYPKIKGQCKSLACLSLRANYIRNLLISLNTQLDQDLTFSLADSTQYKISAPIIRNMTISRLRLLERTDYPEKLPFDI